MKKLVSLITLLILTGFSTALRAQTLLYQWNFTNTTTTTLTSSVPSYAWVPGTGELLMKNGQGTTAIGTNVYFTNGPSVGPGQGPGGSARGALVLTGQGYNGGVPTAVTWATNVNIGQRIKFTLTYWFQFGDRVATANAGGGSFPRLVMLGAGSGYDSGSSGTGVGVGTSVNNWTLATDPAVNGTRFAGSVQTGNGNNSGIIAPRLPVQFNMPTEVGTFTNGIRASDYAITNDNHWYFLAVTFDGTLASGHIKTWLGTSATNVIQVDSQNAAANMLPQANFTTNAILFLANRNNGNRPITDGAIADVRIYAGICNSNNLEAIRTLSNGFVDDGSGQTVTAPVVQLQPQSGVSHVGMSRTFNVQLTGLQPFSFQWKTNSVNVPGATNATFTLSNIPLGLNGAAITCTITNLLGSTNTAAATLTVVPTTPGSYAEAVVTNGPFIYWHLNETTNGVPIPTDPVRIYDYASGLDGTAVDPTNTVWNVNSLAAPLYPGFASTNIAIQARANGNFSRLNMVSLPRYTNDMTICGWIRVTNTPAQHALIYSMNNGNQGPNTFGHGYGLVFGDWNIDVNGNTTRELSYNWSVDSFHPTTYASGLAIPVDEWTFVALTIDPEGTNATLYMGSHGTGLQVSIDDTNTTGDVINGTASPTAPIVLGRSPYSFYEQGQGSANGGNNVVFGDVAIFYKALSPSVITNLYLTGALFLKGERDINVPGNMLLTYPMGTLLESGAVQGPYNPVTGATSPFSIPMTNSANYFRLRYP